MSFFSFLGNEIVFENKKEFVVWHQYNTLVSSPVVDLTT